MKVIRMVGLNVRTSKRGYVMKKTVVTFLALVTFGMVSSTDAFFNPITSPVAAIFGNVIVMDSIIPRNGGGMVTGITAPRIKITDQVAPQTKQCIKLKNQQADQAKKGNQNFVILPLLVPGGSGNRSYY